MIVLSACTTGWSQLLWRWFYAHTHGRWIGEHLWPPQIAAIAIGLVLVPWLALLLNPQRERGTVMTALLAGLCFWLAAPPGLYLAWRADRLYPDGYAPALFMLGGLLFGFFLGRAVTGVAAMLRLRRIRSSRAARSTEPVSSPPAPPAPGARRTTP